jgi:hypothetical protein
MILPFSTKNGPPREVIVLFSVPDRFWALAVYILDSMNPTATPIAITATVNMIFVMATVDSH